FAEQSLEIIQTQLAGTHPVELGQVPHEHEVAAAESSGLLDCDHIGGRFDHAKLRRVPVGGGADGAKFALRQHAAALAMPDMVERFGQSLAQYLAAAAIAFQKIKRHSLRRLRADSGQAAKRVDEPRKCGGVLHRPAASLRTAASFPREDSVRT